MKATLKIKNFRILEDVEIDLRRNTYILGPNGSGKSTFIKALLFLTRNMQAKNEEYNTIYDDENSHNDGLNFKSFKNIVSNPNLEQNIEFIFNYAGKLSDIEEFNIGKIGNLETTDLARLTNDLTRLTKFIIDADGKQMQELFNASNREVNISFSMLITPKGIQKELKLNYNGFLIKINGDKNIKDLAWKNFLNKNTDLKHDKFDDFASISSSNNSKIEEEMYKYIITETGNKILFKPKYEKFEEITKLKSNNLITWLKEQNEWQKLTGNQKRELFLNGILLFSLRISFIQSIISEYLEIEEHFESIRKIPKRVHELSNDIFKHNSYYGLLEVFPSNRIMVDVLDIIENNSTGYSHKCPLTWYIQNMGFGKIVFTKKVDGIGYLKLLTNNNREIDVIDASSGLLQTLPFLTKFATMNLDPPWSLPKISIEQPELHLHPKLQTKLVELLTRENLIIETHSEHIIKKLQVMFAKGEITDADVIINYFDNKNGKTKVKKMEMEANGFFKEPWSDGFFDESYDLTEELLLATRNN